MLNSKKTIMALAFSASFLAVPALAEEPHVAPIRDYIESDIKEWLVDDMVVSAIKEQNAEHANLTEAEIIELDNKWRAEADAADKPMIDGVLKRKISQWLLEKQEESAGLISEVFIMDMHGLNVGQSAQTSDYWQGDEAKFQKTYPMGADAMFIDEVEVDDSSGALQSQASIAIADPATGETIGAITVGINLDAL